jgi:hypothetical protein
MQILRLNLTKNHFPTTTVSRATAMFSLNLLKPSLIPKLKSSCMALLGMAEAPRLASLQRIEAIRQLMLSELGEYGERKFPAVARRVRYAPDIQGLWYARSDVMAIMANTYGETTAREKMVNISSKFKGFLPSSMTSPSSKTSLRAR